jgi:hypothetical protein
VLYRAEQATGGWLVADGDAETDTHEVVIDDLQPATRYRYRLVADNGVYNTGWGLGQVFSTGPTRLYLPLLTS